MSSKSVIAEALAVVDGLVDELVAVRRDIHAHPELSWQEYRTTDLVAARLEEDGITVRRLPGTGLLADIVGDPAGPLVALRADLDALPIQDRTTDAWRSTVAGVAHACGHDVHVAGLLGAGLALHRLGTTLPGRVRLIFQPAEEVMPGGALRVVAAGALDEVSRIFMLHCDPTVDVGSVAVQDGPLTAAADSLTVTLRGDGGHTSRPHRTQDLVFTIGTIITELPAVLSRRVDPRAGVSVVWGTVGAGSATNVIPAEGRLAGTIRMLDAAAWAGAEEIVSTTIEQIVAPYGIAAEIDYARGVPPVVNDLESSGLLALAVDRVLGAGGLTGTAQSLGGEDFAWYLEDVPGAMGRLGTRTPGGPTYDLHRGDYRVDEASVGIASKVLAAAAIEALGHAVAVARSE